MSRYFKRHRTKYYDLLQAIRDTGDWESWLKFFLRGVFEVSQEATAKEIVTLRERHRQMITEVLCASTGKALALLENLYWNPIVSVHHVTDVTQLVYANANRLVEKMVVMNILKEITGRKRDRRFAYDSYLKLFSEDSSA